MRRITLFAVLVVASAACGASSAEPLPLPPGTQPLWFDDVGAPLELSVADATDALAATAAAITERRALDPLPDRLESDDEPRIVFVSASDGRSRARVGMGVGDGFRAALEAAVAGMDVTAAWVKLDVVTRAQPETVVDPGSALRGERSLAGVAFARGSNLAFVAEELVAYTLADSDGVLQPANIADYARETGRDDVAARLFADNRRVRVQRFETESFFRSDGAAIELFRGHVKEPVVDADSTMAAAVAGGEYLARSVRADGSFVYTYLPKVDRAKDQYNMVRHAGTAYAMLELYNHTKDERLLAATERALDYLSEHVVPYGDEAERASVLAYNGKIKLGGVALAALAYATHGKVTGDDRYLDRAQRLCRYIVMSQKADGEFIHQRSVPDHEVLPFISMYYPGEALLALVRLFQRDGDIRWIEAADAGARWLITVRDAGVDTPDLLHDHWLLYALSDLHRARPTGLFIDHIGRIVEAISIGQRTTAEHPDHVGGYSRAPRSTPVATRSEGLMAAHFRALELGDKALADRTMDVAMRNTRLQLVTQIGPERAMYMVDPQRCLGGFTHSFTNYEVRIDYVQHNMSALLALHSALSSM